MNNIFTFDTPIGCLTIGDNGRAIVQVSFDLTSKNTNLKGQPCKIVQTPLINQAFDQLTEYFEKKRQKFDLPLCLNGTPFQTAVWQALMQIPFGKPCSYADLAKAVGNEKAFRAVGMANHRNPIAIIIPCHRVLNSGGGLGGYAGGLSIKQFLLDLEK